MQRAIYLRVTGRLHACLHVGCWASIRGDRAFGITSIEAISLAGALPKCYSALEVQPCGTGLSVYSEPDK